jgi:hypothetical protein
MYDTYVTADVENEQGWYQRNITIQLTSEMSSTSRPNASFASQHLNVGRVGQVHPCSRPGTRVLPVLRQHPK